MVHERRLRTGNPVLMATKATKTQPKPTKTQRKAPPQADVVAPVKRPIIDWEAIEIAYRVGTPSVRALAAEHGCTEGAIRLKAKNEGWARDLTARVAAKTAELLRKDELRTALRTTPGAQATEREQIEISAQVKTNIILAHRKDIPIARSLAMKMFDELGLQTDGIEFLRELGEIMRSPSKSGQDKMNDLYCKIIDLPGRAGTLKALSDVLKTLVALEREAFSVDSDTPPPKQEADGSVDPAEAYNRMRTR